ncbi:MAG: mitochondrial fission ELM1 family protein [Halioglobus sp.]
MPVVWLIDAYRSGERGQVRALVEALGWSCEIKALNYRTFVTLPHVLGQTTLRGITTNSAKMLHAPWPDLVVSCGVRNEPVCRWIREQSGGHTRYVHVGRPWAPLSSFDLVITTPQYRVPDKPNVVSNMLTLHGLSPERLAQARDQWASAFANLPRPLIAVVAGGDSGPFTFGPKAAHRLATQASSIAREAGGALLVTTSARTNPGAADALEAGIDVPGYFYRWGPDASDNPYVGMLAWADSLIVTGDSIAMLSEACATGKPVQMFDLGGMRTSQKVDTDFRLGASLYAFILRWLWQPLSRDISLAHKQMRDSGRVHWLDEEPPIATATEKSPDMQRAVAAIKSLLGKV